MSERPSSTELEGENAALRQRVAELEDARAKLEALCSVIPMFVAFIDRDGVIQDALPTLIITAEMARQGRNTRMGAVVREDHLERCVAVIRESLANRTVLSLEYPIMMGQDEVWCEATCKPFTSDTVLWVAYDITAQRQLAHTQAELRDSQEQVIRAQQAALRELSTPLVPLAEGVVAMPLIGTLDSARAQQAMEKLLDGIVQHQFHTAIVDVTGVRNVDAESADALLRIARAARLLGAQLMLTGINPGTAQTLVELGVDLAGITTRSTLQSGIAHALARPGTRPATPAPAAPTSAARARRDPQGS
ncbi:STAS domain-containing protein [Sorangium sp. So ce385]|uniref:STAS domain-containing protein n=1 Tax=Sorangium sp. So ce385 TaxID=3133308 RepID=UPI003F5B0AF1